MTRRALSTVLALLMLTPGGVCTCEGGPRACPHHPAALSPAGHDGCGSGCHVRHGRAAAAPASETVAAAQHRCPSPLPHQPSCPAATPVAPADASPSADTATVLAAVSAALPATCWVVSMRPPAPVPPAEYVTSPPLFLAHCTFLI